MTIRVRLYAPLLFKLHGREPELLPAGEQDASCWLALHVDAHPAAGELLTDLSEVLEEVGRADAR